ncbi:hypothetical protein BX600DRAFT_507334 [Xylariales sp. PMI_506]|nr:hypothetical protein BX600DRAFT_507334 [Xylariales sp. PMI_506]
MEPRNEESEKWLTHAILLTTVHDTESGPELDAYWPRQPWGAYGFYLGPEPPADTCRRVLQLDAQCDDHNQFKVSGSPQAIEAFYVELDHSSPRVTQGGALYLVTHRACLQLAHRFIDGREEVQDTFNMRPEDEISCIKQLWEVLYRRMPASLPSISEYILAEPHDYFGGRRCRNVYWEPDDDIQYGQLLEADPVETPNVTESILQNLEPEPSDHAKKTLTDDNKVYVQERPTGNSVGEQVYGHPHHSQGWWCDALADGKLFAWLWDLDKEAIRTKQRDGDWDWERLARSFSQVDIYEPTNATLDLPLGLRNRRRIWRVLEEARLDDVASHVTAARNWR